MNPHDSIFKKVFSASEVALDYLKAELPADVWALFLPGSLRLVPGSFVSPALEEYFSDVLYAAELVPPAGAVQKKPKKKGGQIPEKQTVTISFLFEHKSSQPDCIHRQIGLYQFGVWSQQQANNQPLTPVIPFVIYHGKQPWKQHAFPDCFAYLPDTFRRFVPPVEFYLTDLHKMKPAEINQRYHALSLQVLFGLFQSASKGGTLAGRLDEILQGLVYIIDHTHQSELGYAMFTYLTHVMASAEMNRGILTQKIKRLPQTVQTMFKSLYDEIKEEGLQKGREEGREEVLRNKRATAEKCLKLGMSIATAADLADLPEAEVREIAKRLE